jgi:diguanylate cyclase (GGDEF)-like protein/PAS domain S-box-containing protein
MPLIKGTEFMNLIRCKRTLVHLLIIILLALALDVGMCRMLAREHRFDQEESVTLELGALRARLEERIYTSLYLVHGMAANISVRPDLSPNDFDDLANVLLSKRNSLRNIAAAPDYVIRYMYPKTGNEKALGLDYRTVPDQWDQARAARDSRSMALAGPLRLVQGGIGLVARVPVFLPGGGFWGLVSSVIDIDTLLNQAGVAPMSARLDMALRGRDGKGGQGDVFWGDPALFEPEAESVVVTVSLPSGSWLLTGKPRGGWVANSPNAWMVHAAFILLALGACIMLIQSRRDRIFLTESESRLRAMSQASHDALVMIDSRGCVTFWNSAAERMFSYSEAEMLGHRLHDFIAQPGDAAAAKEALKKFAESGTGPVFETPVLELEGVRRSGEIFPVELSVAAFEIGGECFAVGSMRDISTRKLAELRLNELATQDELTGLSNRRHFMEQTSTQLRQAHRYGKDFCFMMFDIDHFKRINDNHGHDVGDEVLRQVGQTMRQVLRGTDIFGRVGGEEFAVAMPETDLDAARVVAERLRETFEELRVRTLSEPARFTVSVGIAHLDSAETLLSQLFKRADEALYEAKNRGRNRVVTDREVMAARPH